MSLEKMDTFSPETLLPEEKDNLLIGHLAALSRTSVGRNVGILISNFQAAAFHLSFILKMPDGNQNIGVFPDIPDRLGDLFQDNV